MMACTLKLFVATSDITYQLFRNIIANGYHYLRHVDAITHIYLQNSYSFMMCQLKCPHTILARNEICNSRLMGQFTKPLITNKIPRLSTQYLNINNNIDMHML
jgi:hypothetical protein